MATLRNQKSLCRTCKLRKVCQGMNDTEEAKVVMCSDYQKEKNGEDKKNNRPKRDK